MEQQARILRSLLPQLERQEGLGEEAPEGISGEFARLKNQSTKYRSDKTYPTKTAEHQDNVKKNRYKDIVPFDHSRVKLSLRTSTNHSDYINANFIKGISGSRAYIATQGPLPHTLLDYLRMLWEYQVKVVVMACREFEMGKRKCERYWPEEQQKTFVCEPFTVYCDLEESKGDYVTRTLRMTYQNSSRTLMQLHYVNWPDHGVPDSIPPILSMLQEMRHYQPHDDVPICIHCSAGCGRTGALCVIDYTWNLLNKQMIPSDFSIYDIVHQMRTQRPSVVQTKEQYKLVYRTIKVLFETCLQSMEEQQQRSGGNEVTLAPKLEDLVHELMDADPPPPTPPPPEAPVTQGEPGLPSPPPTPHAVEASLCLTVEDPYFDSPMCSPEEEEEKEEEALASTWGVKVPALSLNGGALDWTSAPASGEPSALSGTPEEDEPPPLPERTPESYLLAGSTAVCEQLTVIIPPNAAAQAVRELGGSPPSPVPPLPERTPESFQLATDQAPVEERGGARPAADLSRIGTSSEWCGDTTMTTAATVADSAAPRGEPRPWMRSKSLRAKMTFTAPLTFSNLPANCSHATTPSPSPSPAPVAPQSPPPLPQTDRGLTPPPPDGSRRPPESGPGPGPRPARPPARVGVSSEWDGAPQPKSFLDVVMCRSKSVRAKGSRKDPLAAAPLLPLAPHPASAPGRGSVPDVRPSLEHAANQSDRAGDKLMTRTKSLKLFRPKRKSKAPPPTQPGPPPPAANGALPAAAAPSLFKLGFGTRFGKPKGPRDYPDTWF